MSTLADAFAKAVVVPLTTASHIAATAAAASEPAVSSDDVVVAATAAGGTGAESAPRKRARLPGGEQSSKRVRAPLRPVDDAERLSRTVFVGNVAAGTEQKALERFVLASVDFTAVTPVQSMTAETDVTGATLMGADNGVAPLVKGNRSPIESVRFRSIAIEPLAIAPGSDYKAMRKAAAITGTVTTERRAMNAYIVFRDAEFARAALSLNGKLFEGRHLRVDMAAGGRASAPPPGTSAPLAEPGGSIAYDRKRSVFLGNLHYSVDEEEVRAAFGPLVGGGDASIESVRIVRDRATNKGKGFGFVLFAERTHVAEALAAHGVKLHGRPMRVTRCTADVHEGTGGGPKVAPFMGERGGATRGRGAPTTASGVRHARGGRGGRGSFVPRRAGSAAAAGPGVGGRGGALIAAAAAAGAAQRRGSSDASGRGSARGRGSGGRGRGTGGARGGQR